MHETLIGPVRTKQYSPKIVIMIHKVMAKTYDNIIIDTYLLTNFNVHIRYKVHLVDPFPAPSTILDQLRPFFTVENFFVVACIVSFLEFLGLSNRIR